MSHLEQYDYIEYIQQDLDPQPELSSDYEISYDTQDIETSSQNNLDRDETKQSIEDEQISKPKLQRRQSILDKFFKNDVGSDKEQNDMNNKEKNKDCSLKDVTNTSRKSLSRSTSRLKLRDNLSYLLRLNKDKNEENKNENVELEKQVSNINKENENIEFNNENLSEKVSCEYNGIPVSRLAIMGNQQISAFKFQLINQRKSTDTYNFYFKWIVWIKVDKNDILDRIIETNFDLKMFIKFFKRNNEQTYSIFRMGYQPSTKYPNGVKIQFKVDDIYQYDFLKEMCKIIMNDTLYMPGNFQIPVFGITSKFKQLGDYTIVSLWLMENENGDYESIKIFNLLETILEKLSDFLQFIIKTAVVKNNSNSTCRNVYEI